MRKKLYMLFVVLIASIELTICKNENKITETVASHKKHDHSKDKSQFTRGKRSLSNEKVTNGKILLLQNSAFDTKYDVAETNIKQIKSAKVEIDPPFWGRRGKRDSYSSENYSEKFNPLTPIDNTFSHMSCKQCISQMQNADYEYSKERRDESISPFWGNRGRRSYTNSVDSSDFMGNLDGSEEEEPFWGNRGRRMAEAPVFGNKVTHPKKFLAKNRDTYEDTPFWGNRGRRDDIEPFWGNRGRRDEIEPFWGNRGRRDDIEPFWGNRGRRDDIEPFWGNRGRRDDIEPFWGNRGRRNEIEPFWGNRGRRDDVEPFWGNRGRRDESEPFWGNRGRRQDSDAFWGNRGRRKQSEFSVYLDKQNNNLKESIQKAINIVENNIENLARFRRSHGTGTGPYWSNRGRESQIKYLFDGSRYRFQIPNFLSSRLFNHGMKIAPSEPNTVLDDRIYVEQPRFIIVERSSRSSAEEDPFFISRGKKKFYGFELSKAVRDRRGVIEELVKSVRNDPYYIARGKKGSEKSTGNATLSHDDLNKTKELICSTLDLLMSKNQRNKIKKRDITDNERDRRTILKKLAAQLQIDPYFVSRGKKSDDSSANDKNLENFITNISTKCT